MATFLDVASADGFAIIFVFLFVFLVMYGMLTYSKALGQNQMIISLIAVVIAFFAVMSDLATLVIQQVAPIFAVVLVFITVISIATKALGTGMTTADALPNLKWVVLVVLVMALIVGTLSVVRENIDVPERGEDFSKSSTVIFHPNFLGIILISLIAVFTVGLLAVKET